MKTRIFSGVVAVVAMGSSMALANSFVFNDVVATFNVGGTAVPLELASYPGDSCVTTKLINPVSTAEGKLTSLSVVYGEIQNVVSFDATIEDDGDPSPFELVLFGPGASNADVHLEVWSAMTDGGGGRVGVSQVAGNPVVKLYDRVAGEWTDDHVGVGPSSVVDVMPGGCAYYGLFATEGTTPTSDHVKMDLSFCGTGGGSSYHIMGTALKQLVPGATHSVPDVVDTATLLGAALAALAKLRQYLP